VVYEALHVELGRRVAIKVLDADHTCSRDFAVRFRREARALSRLHHPGLVRVFDFGQNVDGRLFCVMELLEGHTLRHELSQHEALPWQRALRIARRVCQALEAAHGRQVVHRDIKPENLFVGADDHVKLIDFGLARTGESEDARADEAAEGDLGALTLFGTPEYMAPEQVSGGQVDHRADIYALGSVLYEMLSGRLPFADDSAVKQLDAKLRGSPEPVHERAPQRGIPRAVSRLVSRALARHPSRRFASAAEMADAISLALDEPTRQRSRRRAFGASVMAAMMGFGVVLVVQTAKPWLEELPARLPWLRQPTEAPRPREQHQDPPEEEIPGDKSAQLR
jgi:serine/threonine protein kinase